MFHEETETILQSGVLIMKTGNINMGPETIRQRVTAGEQFRNDSVRKKEIET